ncbi:hypothetical protein D3C86_1466260 [compost metagenome]
MNAQAHITQAHEYTTYIHRINIAQFAIGQEAAEEWGQVSKCNKSTEDVFCFYIWELPAAALGIDHV